MQLGVVSSPCAARMEDATGGTDASRQVHEPVQKAEDVRVRADEGAEIRRASDRFPDFGVSATGDVISEAVSPPG